MPKLLSSPVKCGVIGYGGTFNMGKGHLDQMRAAGMQPTAVCEIDRARLEQATHDFPGIETYSSVDEMLAKSPVEFIAIITPHNTHAPLAIQCLNAKRHVISEKPLAITTAECDAILAAAHANDVVITTYHNRHWDGNILSAIDHLVKKKLIGEIVRITIRWGGRAAPLDWWRSDRRVSGGVLYDWGVHLLENALQLLPDRKAVEVTGFAHDGYWVGQAKARKPWHDSPNEDEARLIVRMDNGVAIDLTVSQLDSGESTNVFEVVGTEGHYAMNFNAWTRTYFNDAIKIVETGPHPPGEGQKLYQNVNDHLTRGEPLVITGEWARRMIHLIDLAGQSAKQGRSLATIYG